MGPLGTTAGRAAVAGALTIAFSAILVRLSHASPSTAAVFRCGYAVPVLGLLAWRERRLYGPRPRRDLRLSVWAGLFFAADLICWHHSIADVGAGLATVLGNLQVVLVGLVAGAVIGDVSLAPSWPEHGWLVLLALSSQVVGWLLISVSLPRLPAAVTSVLLTIQPVGSVLLGVVILGEAPSSLQLLGVLAVFSGIVVATVRRSAPVTA